MRKTEMFRVECWRCNRVNEFIANGAVNCRHWDELDEMLKRIRSERQLRPLVLKCPKCGQISEGAAPQVSVRAMILSVLRFNIDDVDATRAEEKRWKAYQKENRLDLNGKVAGAEANRPSLAHCHSR